MKTRLKSVPVRETQLPEELLSQATPDTASTMMEIYESIEQSYRAAMMAGIVTSHVSNSTNPS